MKPIDQVRLCVIDKGQFPFIADMLGQKCAKVWYWCESDDPFPTLKRGAIGRGSDTYERVADFWKIKSQCDGFVFPDCGYGGIQAELISQGFAVWGQNGLDALETNRGMFLNALKDLGLSVPPHRIIVGMTELTDWLKNEQDKYIKISKWRGDWETLHYIDWETDQEELMRRALRLGPLCEEIPFYVFDPIKTEVEDGIDSVCVDGQLPKNVIHGLECKDKAFLASHQTMDEMDEGMAKAYKGLATLLDGYRAPLSLEARLDGEFTYPIDPTMRCGAPPSQLQTNFVTNLADTFWHGANGEILEPEFESEFAVQAQIVGDRDGNKDGWLTLKVPDELRPYCKFSFSCEYGNRTLIAPSELGTTVGWLVANGDTIKEAVENLKEYRKSLPSDLDCDINSLANLIEEAHEAKDLGVNITDQQIPEPAIVLDDK